jgi:hypothetical protein
MKRLILFLALVFISINIQGLSPYKERILGYIETENAIYVLRGSAFKYIITIDSNRVSSGAKLIIDGTEYRIDDRVLITGTLSFKEDGCELEIETIEDAPDYTSVIEGTYKMTCFRQFETYERSLSINYIPPVWQGLVDLYWDFDLPASIISVAYMLNESSFIIESFEEKILEYTWGEGYIKNDSLFIKNKHYKSDSIHETLLFTDCSECIGTKNGTSGTSSISSLNKIQVYYNATEQSIVIDLDQTFFNKGLTFELFDMQGRILLTKIFSGSQKIKASSLSKGVYLYRLSQGNEIITSSKILK